MSYSNIVQSRDTSFIIFVLSSSQTARSCESQRSIHVHITFPNTFEKPPFSCLSPIWIVSHKVYNNIWVIQLYLLFEDMRSVYMHTCIDLRRNFERALKTHISSPQLYDVWEMLQSLHSTHNDRKYMKTQTHKQYIYIYIYIFYELKYDAITIFDIFVDDWKVFCTEINMYVYFLLLVMTATTSPLYIDMMKKNPFRS